MNAPTRSDLRKPIAGDVSFLGATNDLVREGDLFETLEGNRVHCYACAHHCKIGDGARGICQVRYNRGGKLYVPRGYTAALQCDPIEKKPFSHVLPGSDALTFGMLGCDLHCGYCQNWDISQALRDPDSGHAPSPISSAEIVAAAKRLGARALVSSYNEPLITSEWAVEIFKLAQAQGLLCAYVSNGNATREVLEYIRPYVSAYKIDLKSMRDKNYRSLGAPLDHILEGIKLVHEFGFWLEIVTLIVPGFNDSTEELMDAAHFIRSLSPDIPWHVTAFHKDYKMMDPSNTDAKMLIRAAEIGEEAGLHFVYAGNLPGRAEKYENTYCPSCNALLIARMGYLISEYKLTDQGTCWKCGEKIPGIWHASRQDARVGNPDFWWTRAPRNV